METAEVENASPMEIETATELQTETAAAAAATAEEKPAEEGAVDPIVADGPSSPSTVSSDDDMEGSGGEGDGDTPAAAAAAKTSSKTPEEKLIKAMGYKDKGNACIAAGDSAGALKHYERGVKIVSKLGTADQQARAVLLTLRLNLALACTKEERYSDAVSAATKVLEIDATNLKALFRRGVARARLGLLEGAKADLLSVVKADPRNGGAKKELKVVRDRLEEHRKKEKASYSGLFDKGPMYNDKEVERQKREAEALKRQKEEEAEWSKANEQRKADGKEEQTLEDWRKEKKEMEEKSQKEREEREKLKPRTAPAPRAPPKAGKEGGGQGGGDDMELDEDDLKIIQDTKKQGYCYFKRTLSDKDQKLLDAEQIKLRARVASPPTVSEQKEGDGNGVVTEALRSAWNNAGTWEEKEKTEWCKEKLTEAFSKVSVAVGKDASSDPEFLLEKLGGFDFASAAGDGAGPGQGLEALSQLKQSLAKLTAKVTKVDVVEADARVICVSNKIKHLFEFNVKVKFSLTVDESMGLPPLGERQGGPADKTAAAAGSVKTYKGTLEFPDLTNADVDNGRFEVDPELKWDKGARWESTYDERVKTCISDFKAGLLSALGDFFVEYRTS